MRSGSRPSPEGTKLPFAGGTVSPMMMCPADGQQKDDKKGQMEDNPRWGQRQSRKNKSRPQRSSGFSLNLYMPGVSRWSGVISHDKLRYIVILYPISFDISRYDISRYCIHIPNFWDWYQDIVSRRKNSRYRTHFFAQLAAPGLVHQESKRNHGYLAVELKKQW